MLSRGLGEEGFEVVAVADAASAMAQAEEPPDGLVIDIGLPDADGRDLCQALRARGVDAPVLFLTARDAVTDRLSGFSAGGDDYVTKPFHFDEVVARLRALLRRSGADASTTVGALRLDPVAHSISGPAARPRSPRPSSGCWRRWPASPARCCAGASSCARRGPRARSCTTTRSTSTWRACAASCARPRRRPRSRPRTGSATGCYEALSHAARPAHRARAARRARRGGGAHGGLQRHPRPQPQRGRQRPRAVARGRRGRDRRVRRTATCACTRRSTTPIVDRRVWVYEGMRAIERPPATAELQRTADALAGSRPRVRRRARQRRAPLRHAGARARPPGRAPWSPRSRWPPMTAPPISRCSGSLVLGGGAARRGGRPDLDHRRARARPGARDDRVGGGLERARSRPALRRRHAAPRRAGRAGAHVRRAAGPRGRQPAPRAAPVGRALARAAHAAGADRGRDRAPAAARALARGAQRGVRASCRAAPSR